MLSKCAATCAARLATDEYDANEGEIRKNLKADYSFKSANGDIVVSIQDCVMPKPKRAARPTRIV